MSTLAENDRLARVWYLVDSHAHIRVNSDICATCETQACIPACPAECFTPQAGSVSFSYQHCLECGACRIVCPNGAVDWSYPRGGFGVSFQF